MGRKESNQTNKQIMITENIAAIIPITCILTFKALARSFVSINRLIVTGLIIYLKNNQMISREFSTLDYS